MIYKVYVYVVKTLITNKSKQLCDNFISNFFELIFICLIIKLVELWFRGLLSFLFFTRGNDFALGKGIQKQKNIISKYILGDKCFVKIILPGVQMHKPLQQFIQQKFLSLGKSRILSILLKISQNIGNFLSQIQELT